MILIIILVIFLTPLIQIFQRPSDFLLNQSEVGSSHVSHDRLVNYMYALAESSNRVSIQNRGTTFEGRPLILLTITSEKNQKNIDELRKNHLSFLNVIKNKFNFYNRPVCIISRLLHTWK